MIPAAIGAAATVYGIGKEIFGGDKDKKQLKQQEKLNELQLKGNKEMADYNQNLAKEMWNYTSYGNQRKQMEEAGINPALMYGMSGGGGQTAGGGSGSGVGGAAADSGATRSQTNMNMALLGAQLANIESQTNKNNADAEAKRGVETNQGNQNIKEAEQRTKALEFQNQMNELFGRDNATADRDMKQMSKEEQNYKWEMYKAIAWESGNVTDRDNTAAKALKAEFDKGIIELRNAKADNDIKKATAIIEGFKANLAKEGFSPETPWYIKTLETFMNKAGIHVTDYIK